MRVSGRMRGTCDASNRALSRLFLPCRVVWLPHGRGATRTTVAPAGCWLSEAQRPWEDGVRVTTAFNRLLALQGARVIDVLFGPAGTTVQVALRRRRAACSGCGQVWRRVHDRALRRWRHLDLAGPALLGRVRAAGGALSGLRRQGGGHPVGSLEGAAHARLRGSRRVLRAADGQDADRRAAACR